MNNKKISFIVLFVTFVISFIFSNVSANELEIGDFYAKADSYSLSEDSDDIYMPFMRFSTSNINVDRKINNIGAIFSNKGIEIKEEITKPVALFSQDTIRVNETISDAAIFSTTNVIVEKGTNGTLIIFAVGDITISEDAEIKGDLICYSTNLYIKGKVSGNVLGACNKVEVQGNIQKDLRMEVEDISVNGEDKITGEIYLETIGKNTKVETLKTIYPDLINKIIEKNGNTIANNKVQIINTIISTLVTVFLSWILYLIINKASKTKIFENNLAKLLKYKTPVIMIGALSLVAIPIILFVCIILLVFGAYIIAVPVLAIYFALLILGASANIFIIGSFVSTFVLSKVDINEKRYLKVLIPLGVFLAVSILPIIPYVSGIIGTVYVMVTIGIISVCMLKKSEKVGESK